MQSLLPPYSPKAERRLILLSAPEGAAKARLLADWVTEASQTGVASFLLPCAFERGGTWAGVKDLLRKILPDIGAARPDLIRQHASELGLVLPTLRKSLAIESRSLTDTASATEKVRNYPLDRAYRLVHGLINLLDGWQEHVGARGLVLVCDDFDRAGSLVQHFFRELLRRRGGRMNLTLMVVGSPQKADLGEQFQGSDGHLHLRVELEAAQEKTQRSPQEETALAKGMEEAASTDHLLREELLPEIIDHWRHSESPERADFWICLALAQAHHFGFYEDALRYGTIALDNLETIVEIEKLFPRWTVVGTIVESYLALGMPEPALELTLSHGLDREKEPATLVRICYVLALIYSRFLRKPDFEKADAFVQLGLENLEKADLEEQDRIFLKVFTLNGLAFIRHRQGRPEEALELCRSGFSLLSEKLGPEQHRLHRSILLYNMAQVFAAIGSLEEAIAHYSRAMEFDPNYSEYYNERGNMLLKLGKLPEALSDYQEALRLSAPYHEIFVNMGQAYKLLGQYDAAIDSYSRALDLDPKQILPLLGRAQACEAVGRFDEAIASYTSALSIDGNQPLVLANRATLYFEEGLYRESLADLTVALELSPENPDLFRNRAVAFTALGRHGEARSDLIRCLQLGPEESERDEIDAQLIACESAMSAASSADLDALQPTAAG